MSGRSLSDRGAYILEEKEEEQLSEEKVEFRWLEAKCIGSDNVVFKLEDGAMVKIKVDIGRAGVAVNYTNPDGSPHYNIGTNIGVTVVPPDKKFSIPRSQIAAPPKPPEKPPTMVT